MSVDSVSYDPLQFVAGSAPHRSLKVTIPAAANAIPALTPMKYDAAFKAIPATALTDKIIGVTIPGPNSQTGALEGIPDSGSDQFAHLYTHIDLFGSMVDYTAMASADNDLKKSSIFVGSGINLVFPAAGQV